MVDWYDNWFYVKNKRIYYLSWQILSLNTEKLIGAPTLGDYRLTFGSM